MVGVLVLQMVAIVGFLTAVTTGSVYLYRQVPGVYPRERTRLDTRTYRIVRSSLAAGIVVGAFGAILSLVDTVGSLQVTQGAQGGLLARIAILLPAWITNGLVRVGVALLLGGALIAGAVEVRNARE